MRWSIRNQILVPLIALQAVAVVATAAATATLAARRSERQIVERLGGVVEALGHSSFPYTASVLQRMRSLSGAHFIAYDDSGRVSETSLETGGEIPRALATFPPGVQPGSLGDWPWMSVAGTRYVVWPLRSSKPGVGRSLLVLYPETSWRQARWEAALPSLVLGAGSLAAMALVTSWMAHRIAERIRRLQQQVALIAEGDFKELDVDGPRDDEVRDLSRSINRMCAQLDQMRRTIRESERTRLLAQLAAGLAHQLRNSLTGARMSVQLHARRYPSPEGDQSLDVALRQLAMTEEQVKGLLTLGRVERRASERVDLDALLADVALLVQPSCQHARVQLRLAQEHGGIVLLADRSSVRAAVLNLTLNAIEAAGSGGVVSLETSVTENDVAIEVTDTGPGPPLELAASLCEPFVTSKPEGVGLGLALAQQVATEHGGHLSWHRSSNETCFRLALPRVDVRPGEPR